MVGIFPGGSELATEAVEVDLRCADEHDSVDAGSQPSRRRAAPSASSGCAALGGAGTNGTLWLIGALCTLLRIRRR
jgi:hypothetical protein